MKVICIKQHSHGILAVGKIYEVYNVTTCRCGQIDFDVGISKSQLGSLGSICACGQIDDKGIIWINSNKFAPLEEKGQMFIEEFIEVEQEY